MKRFVFATLSVLILFCSCSIGPSAQKQTPQAQSKLPEEDTIVTQFDASELEIVNRIIDSVADGNDSILLKENLSLTSYSSRSAAEEAASTGAFIKEQFGEINDEVLGNFIQENSKKMTLDDASKFNDNCIWYSIFKSENIDSQGKFDVWTAARDHLKNFKAIMEFSKVGFNSEKNLALVYVGIRRGPMSGHGDYLYMRKEKSEWVIIKVIGRWES